MTLAVLQGETHKRNRELCVIYFMSNAFVSETTPTAHEVGVVSFILWKGSLRPGEETCLKLPLIKWWPDLDHICPTPGPGLFLPYDRDAEGKLIPGDGVSLSADVSAFPFPSTCPQREGKTSKG